MSSWLGSSRPKKVSDELEAIRSEIASISARVSQLAGSAGDSLRDNVAQLRAALPDAGQLSGQASKAVAGALDEGRRYLDQAGAEVRGGVRQARAAVSDNPLAAMAVAAGVGFLVGLMCGRRHDA
ncbi:hypothetical protein ACFFJB_04720 [Camelimonas abortus]|uniref:DUF883 domain-containing protein n=1 Tax=Camelimonas abortus TaxID=1017184 RepID=A0ABV7LBJ5_9HYPH